MPPHDNPSTLARLRHALSLPSVAPPRPLPRNATQPAPSSSSTGGGPLVVQARDLGRRASATTLKTKTKSSIKKRSRVVEQRRAKATAADAIENMENAAQFVDKHRHDVGRFGAQALDKRHKKAYEAQQLERLGCRRPKNRAMPIGLLQHVRAKQHKRESEKHAVDLAAGNLVRCTRRRHGGGSRR